MPPAHVLHVFPTFVAAGAQVRTVGLMEGLGSRYRHSVLSLSGAVDALRLVPHGIETQALQPPPGGSGGLRWMRRLLRAERPDLLCTYNWGSFDAVLAARATGVRALLHHEDGFNADEAERQKARRVWARRIFLRGARGVVVPSERLRSIACESWRLPASRVHLVPNGVHVERFANGAGAEVRERFGIPPEALVVGTVGHLRPVKRFDRLIEACAAVDPATLAGRPLHLLLIGDGEQRATLETAARGPRAASITVHFAGHQDALGDFYAAMDVFCLSSDSEQQPISLLEAMAARVPIAATDVGDVRRTLPAEAGAQLCPLAGEATGSDLARALERLLGDADLRGELAALGFERVHTRYSHGAMVDSYAALYESAMSAG